MPQERVGGSLGSGGSPELGSNIICARLTTNVANGEASGQESLNDTIPRTTITENRQSQIRTRHSSRFPPGLGFTAINRDLSTEAEVCCRQNAG